MDRIKRQISSQTTQVVNMRKKQIEDSLWLHSPHSPYCLKSKGLFNELSTELLFGTGVASTDNLFRAKLFNRYFGQTRFWGSKGVQLGETPSRHYRGKLHFFALGQIYGAALPKDMKGLEAVSSTSQGLSKDHRSWGANTRTHSRHTNEQTSSPS